MDITGISPIAELAKSVIDRFWPDASEAERGKLTFALTQLNAEMEMMKGQMAVNQTEAGSANFFVSGWRPAVGWICVLAFFAAYVGQPALIWLCWLVNPALTPPNLGIDHILNELLFGLLGLAGIRSFEKVKGVAR